MIAAGDSWAIYQGDCRDFIAEAAGFAQSRWGTHLHVLTDPPYRAAVSDGYRVLANNDGPSRGTLPSPADRIGAPGLPIGTGDSELVATTAPLIAGVCDRWALVFSDVESIHLWREALIASGMRYIRTCAWDRINGAPQFSADRPAVGFEPFTVCHRSDRTLAWNAGGRRGLYRCTRARDRHDHPTPKPEALMEALVLDFTDPGDVILDPFMGSGTTGVAALRWGRRFVGIEIEVPHWETARARLEGAAAVVPMFGGVS